MARGISGIETTQYAAHSADCGEPIPCCPFCGSRLKDLDMFIAECCGEMVEPEYWCSGCDERVTQDGATVLA